MVGVPAVIVTPTAVMELSVQVDMVGFLASRRAEFWLFTGREAYDGIQPELWERPAIFVDWILRTSGCDVWFNHGIVPLDQPIEEWAFPWTKGMFEELAVKLPWVNEPPAWVKSS